MAVRSDVPPTASLCTIMISLYCISELLCLDENPVIVRNERLFSGSVGILGVFLCTTQDGWCHCWIDRQWRESQSSWSSRRCPRLTQILCVTPPNTHTPIPQFTVHSSWSRQPLNPISVPFFPVYQTDRPPPRQAKEPNYTLSNNKSLLWPHNGP